MSNSLNRAREQARELDRHDTLSEFRDQFWIPKKADGGEQLYFCGNSLGLQPKGHTGDLFEDNT